MSKEYLEVLKIGIPKLKKLYENNAKKMSKNDILGFDLTFVYLDKALAELESIDNSKPSEALRELERIKNQLFEYFKGNEVRVDDIEDYEKFIFEPVKQYILKAQKQEEDIIHYKGTVDNLRRDNALLKELNAEYKRVLDIIFEKRVDICILNDCDNVNEYNKSLGNFRPAEDRLTYEEFELLKETLV